MGKPRKRISFPPAERWIVLENSCQHPLNVVMEPWGTGGVIPSAENAYVLVKAENAYVLVKPDSNQPATIIIGDNTIQVYCADAMYRDGIEVVDMTDEEPADA